MASCTTFLAGNHLHESHLSLELYARLSTQINYVSWFTCIFFVLLLLTPSTLHPCLKYKNGLSKNWSLHTVQHGWAEYDLLKWSKKYFLWKLFFLYCIFLLFYSCTYSFSNICSLALLEKKNWSLNWCFQRIYARLKEHTRMNIQGSTKCFILHLRSCNMVLRKHERKWQCQGKPSSSIWW